MKNYSYWVIATAIIVFAPSANAWISGGVVLGGPVYYYPAPVYAYPAPYPYPYPAPMPQQPSPPVPGGPVYSSNVPAQEECREYSHDVIIAGARQAAHGHACRQQDGTWRIVD